MGCMQSVSTPPEDAPVDPSAVNPSVVDTTPQLSVPVGLKGLVETAVLGAITHGISPLKRKISLVLKNGDVNNTADDAIEIAKHGEYYILHGTHAVVDIATCEIIGFLENDAFIKECSDYVKSICEKHNLTFKN